MKNQNKQMKTEVETFFVEEVIELIHDGEKLDEWKELANSLGIIGQKSLVSKDKSPIPFLYLKNGMVRVFETLCPVKIDYKSFDRTPIPLEILRLMKLSIDEHYFSKLQVWYDDKSPDPVVIGVNESWVIRKKNEWTDLVEHGIFRSEKEGKKYLSDYNIDILEVRNSYSDKHYLLGKWADVKQSLEELKDRATVRYMKTRRAEIEQRIKTEERDLEDLINATEIHFE